MIPYMDTPLAEHADKLREVADAGYTDFWSAEAGGADAFTPLALASQWVPSAQLGTAIVPAYTRGPGSMYCSYPSGGRAGAGDGQRARRKLER